jgi:alkylation response protein AidB-like acyl-CoA dehydrogenase
VIPYLTPEQRELRREVRKLLRSRGSLAQTRLFMSGEQGYDPDLWHSLAVQMGLVGLAVEPEHGGSGPAYVEIAIVAEELGYLCVGVPYLSTVLAACALQPAGESTAAKELLPLLAAGERSATLCVANDSGHWTVDGPSVNASSHAGQQWRLSGRSTFVVDGGSADHLVVLGLSGGEPAFYLVDASGAGVTVTDSPSLDLTRRLAEVRFRDAPAQLVTTVGAGDAVSRVLDVAAVLSAAEALGGARACLDMAVQYAKDRQQFGRPIGSFQAIKHKCADMLVKVDGATSAVFYASRVIGTPDEVELPAVASLAKAYCSDAFFDVAGDNIQIHGGIGFTWEHDAHLFFKRATTSRLLFGDPHQHRELMLQSIGVA